jgi:hypothetical protein
MIRQNPKAARKQLQKKVETIASSRAEAAQAALVQQQTIAPAQIAKLSKESIAWPTAEMIRQNPKAARKQLQQKVERIASSRAD